MKVKIKDKEVKIGYGLYFLGVAQKELNTDLNGLLQGLIKYPISEMVDLLWLSIKCEASLDEVELPIKKRDLVEHLQDTKDFEDEDGILAKFSNNFVKSIRGSFIGEEEGESSEEETPEKKN